MKRNTSVTAMAALVLLGSACVTVRGQTDNIVPAILPLTLNFRMTAVTEDLPSVGHSSITKYATASTKINNQFILNGIARALSMTISPHSELVLETNRHVYVEYNGAQVVDVTAPTNVLTLATNSIAVYTGQDNGGTLSKKRAFNYITTLQFDDKHGTSFDCDGFAAEKYSLSDEKQGGQTGSDSLVISCYGRGTVIGVDAIFSGKITSSGRTAVASP